MYDNVENSAGSYDCQNDSAKSGAPQLSYSFVRPPDLSLNHNGAKKRSTRQKEVNIKRCILGIVHIQYVALMQFTA